MIGKSEKRALKQLCTSGAFDLIKEVIQEIKTETKDVPFTGSAEQLVFDTGKAQGYREALDYLIDKVETYAKSTN